MNPLDALLLPPALIKRAADDLHDIAAVVRRLATLEQEVTARADRLERELRATRAAVEALPGHLAQLEGQLALVQRELGPMRHLEPIRSGIEPLERSMIAVRDSVDELEPMISDLDGRIRSIAPKLDDMHESIEPIGDLAERVPGARKRRSG
jgi:chromosome segregation ATPase